MGKTVLSLGLGLALFLITNAPTVAETCTGYYQKCGQFCTTAGKITRCMNDCANLRRQCMKTGTWKGRSGTDKNVEKR